MKGNGKDQGNSAGQSATVVDIGGLNRAEDKTVATPRDSGQVIRVGVLEQRRLQQQKRWAGDRARYARSARWCLKS